MLTIAPRKPGQSAAFVPDLVAYRAGDNRGEQAHDRGADHEDVRDQPGHVEAEPYRFVPAPGPSRVRDRRSSPLRSPQTTPAPPVRHAARRHRRDPARHRGPGLRFAQHASPTPPSPAAALTSPITARTSAISVRDRRSPMGFRGPAPSFIGSGAATPHQIHERRTRFACGSR